MVVLVRGRDHVGCSLGRDGDGDARRTGGGRRRWGGRHGGDGRSGKRGRWAACENKTRRSGCDGAYRGTVGCRINLAETDADGCGLGKSGDVATKAI